MELRDIFWRGLDRMENGEYWMGKGAWTRKSPEGSMDAMRSAGSPKEKGASGKVAGFTLIELLVAIAIIAVLAVMLSVAAGKVRVMTDRTKCASNLRQIGLAAQSYAAENNGTFPLSYDLVLGVNNPVATGLIDRLRDYVGPESEWKIFYCPDAEHCVPPPAVAKDVTYEYQLTQTGKNRFFRIGYFWLVTTSHNWRTLRPSPPIKMAGSVQRVLAVCPHFGGGVVHDRLQNVLFSDGRVESRTATVAGIIPYINQQKTEDGQEALTFKQ